MDGNQKLVRAAVHGYLIANYSTFCKDVNIVAMIFLFRMKKI